MEKQKLEETVLAPVTGGIEIRFREDGTVIDTLERKDPPVLHIAQPIPPLDPSQYLPAREPLAAEQAQKVTGGFDGGAIPNTAGFDGSAILNTGSGAIEVEPYSIIEIIPTTLPDSEG